jgi:hypothetical protein
MPKHQINIKLPPELIESLKTKAGEEGKTLTDLIQGYCERGLGLPPNTANLNLNEIYERISSQLERCIPIRVDERIASQMAETLKNIDAKITEQVQRGIEQEVEKCLGELSA